MRTDKNSTQARQRYPLARIERLTSTITSWPSSMSMMARSSMVTGRTKSNTSEPPVELSSGVSLSDSWMISTFPKGSQLGKGASGPPPDPTPGPPPSQFSFGDPRSVSPSRPPGLEVSKTRAAPPGAYPLLPLGMASMTTPYSSLSSSVT